MPKVQKKNICYEYKTVEEISDKLQIPLDKLIIFIIKNRSLLGRYTVASKDNLYYNIEKIKELYY